MLGNGPEGGECNRRVHISDYDPLKHRSNFLLVVFAFGTGKLFVPMLNLDMPIKIIESHADVNFTSPPPPFTLFDLDCRPS